MGDLEIAPPKQNPAKKTVEKKIRDWDKMREAPSEKKSSKCFLLSLRV